MEPHVAEWKVGEVKALSDLLTKSKVVGIVEIGGIPAPQLQHMRKNLQGVASVRSAKNRLIFRALDQAEKEIKGISSLKEKVTGQTAIITTEMNPFKLFAQLKMSRTNAPARGGETASHDISVKAGETPFKPGPIVGELQKVGIPAAIQEGKVIIKEDKVIVPEGEQITPEIAQMLTRLEINPIEIGMTLHAVFENGSVFSPDILDINMDEFMGQLKIASNNVFNLAIEMGWITKETIQPLLTKAHNDAFTLALEKGIINKETIKHLLSNANAKMLALKKITS